MILSCSQLTFCWNPFLLDPRFLTTFSSPCSLFVGPSCHGPDILTTFFLTTHILNDPLVLDQRFLRHFWMNFFAHNSLYPLSWTSNFDGLSFLRTLTSYFSRSLWSKISDFRILETILAHNS